jgi:hyaluronan synthase
MFTNRGPFALIRASAFREVIDVYANEEFYGHRVILADDSLTALAGSMAGKSVQQISAVAFTMWPEKLGHHTRQRTRWARGRTVRNFWRLKYLPVTSYLWWYTAASIYSFIIGFALLLIVIGSWPHSETIALRASVVLGWVSQLRILAFRRSDETKLVRFLTVAIRPVASLWSAIVLTRIIRLYGTATFLKQGWTTRQNGVEETMRPQEATT